ncbi:hypothetical protein [Polaromonas sp.]|uniref:hypothetical protein n=1 Tax=Polaromonas sp. TaxID=1869339 RepID=UPI00356570E6
MSRNRLRFAKLLTKVASCSSTKPPSAPALVPSAAVAPLITIHASADKAVAPVLRAQSMVETVAAQPMDKANSRLTKRRFHNSDSVLIQDCQLPMVVARATCLRAERLATVLRADQRGGRLYALIPGQKRAEAGSKSPLLLGVPQSEMAGISFGHENSSGTARDEYAGIANRRADLNYLGH